jgi:hypothetical protein
MAVELGRLERVDLRKAWTNEATEFTPWLARSDILEILAEALGLELELEAQEQNVGPFKADILCKDIQSGHWVLIENQLEKTDHTHLGQLLTYAAGLQAVSIIWVAAKFTDQHRATLDWLNEITDERFNFFGLEVELWRIGDSLSAPKFNIISQPNDWTRGVSTAAKSIESEALTDTQARQLAYWNAFRERLASKPGGIRTQKPYPQHWMNFSVGRTGYWISATLNAQEGRAGIELNMNNTPEDKGNYQALLSQRPAIEQEIVETLEWMELPGRKSSRVAAFRKGIEPLNEANWPELMSWMEDQLIAFRKVFQKRIKELPAA